MFALPYNSEWTYFKSKIKCHDRSGSTSVLWEYYTCKWTIEGLSRNRCPATLNLQQPAVNAQYSFCYIDNRVTTGSQMQHSIFKLQLESPQINGVAFAIELCDAETSFANRMIIEMFAVLFTRCFSLETHYFQILNIRFNLNSFHFH